MDIITDAPLNRAVLPFFIPMQGCKNRCIFCDQRQISSHEKPPTATEITDTVNKLIEPHELAFYGGSFTCLSLKQQEYYLKAAQVGLQKGLITSIRLSTRPDAISHEELNFLRNYGVKCIELGVQSMDNDVLQASARGYNSDAVLNAMHLLKEHKFITGIQLMPGLPQDTKEKSLQTAILCRKLNPNMIRIYPTLVIKNTVLADLFLQKLYLPLTLSEAIQCCLEMAAVFLEADIPIIRLGLHNSKSLANGIIAGPFEPAFGAFVYSALAKEHMRFALNLEQGALYAPKSYLPLLFGHHACNKAWIMDNIPQGIHGDNTLASKSLRINGKIFSQKQFLKQYIEYVIRK